MQDRAAELDEAIQDLDWTVPPDGAVKGWFDAPSGRLATLAMGDPADQWVVLVPGVTGSKEDFVLMLPLLAEAGYYAFSFDMAGQYESRGGGTAATRATGYDHQLFADDLVAVLEAAPGPSHVLGYSFAGTVAQLVYARPPGPVRRASRCSARRRRPGRPT